MKVICRMYFPDSKGIWHQPGSTWDCEENNDFVKKGFVKKISTYETAAMVQPEIPVNIPLKRGRRKTK